MHMLFLCMRVAGNAQYLVTLGLKRKVDREELLK
jgi:hypothetical protein